MVSVEAFSVPRLAFQLPFDAFPVITRPKGNPSLLDDFVHFSGQLQLRLLADLRTVINPMLKITFTVNPTILGIKLKIALVCKYVVTFEIIIQCTYF